MNIHFTDNNLFQTLKANSLFSIQIGSHLYGLNTKDSDCDILYIVADSVQMNHSFLWEHHQLQYKENNCDHIFTSLKQFIRNLITGDSTINFEVIHSQELAGSSLKFLYENRLMFYNYQITKSYLGLARRDIKQVDNNKNYTNLKKLSHAYRGLVTSYGILNKNYSNDFINYQNKFQEIKDLKFSNFNGDMVYLISYLHNEIDMARDQLNNLFNQHKINRIMSLENMAKLDQCLEEIQKSEEYLSRANYSIDKKLYYNVLENGLKY